MRAVLTELREFIRKEDSFYSDFSKNLVTKKNGQESKNVINFAKFARHQIHEPPHSRFYSNSDIVLGKEGKPSLIRSVKDVFSESMTFDKEEKKWVGNEEELFRFRNVKPILFDKSTLTNQTTKEIEGENGLPSMTFNDKLMMWVGNDEDGDIFSGLSFGESEAPMSDIPEFTLSAADKEIIRSCEREHDSQLAGWSHSDINLRQRKHTDAIRVLSIPFFLTLRSNPYEAEPDETDMLSETFSRTSSMSIENVFGESSKNDEIDKTKECLDEDYGDDFADVEIDFNQLVPSNSFAETPIEKKETPQKHKLITISPNMLQNDESIKILMMEQQKRQQEREKNYVGAIENFDVDFDEKNETEITDKTSESKQPEKKTKMTIPKLPISQISQTPVTKGKPQATTPRSLYSSSNDTAPEINRTCLTARKTHKTPSNFAFGSTFVKSKSINEQKDSPKFHDKNVRTQNFSLHSISTPMSDYHQNIKARKAPQSLSFSMSDSTARSHRNYFDSTKRGGHVGPNRNLNKKRSKDIIRQDRNILLPKVDFEDWSDINFNAVGKELNLSFVPFRDSTDENIVESNENLEECFEIEENMNLQITKKS